MKADQCQATTRTGKRCSALAVPGDNRCAWHTELPEWVAKRQQWSAEGGRKRSNLERAKKNLSSEVMTPNELMGALSKALRDVLSGDLEPGRGNAASSIANAITKLRESVEVDERLAALEAAAGISERRTG